ncbi:MAG: hypothetical protein L0154_24080 [Chloroflexi bacterium]|nr:hypothetical protein [Chloroflexota bacterium]
MIKRLLPIILLFLLVHPVTAQDRIPACGSNGNPSDINFDIDEGGNLDINGFHEQVIAFLDNSENSYALVSYFASLNLNTSDIKHAQVIVADVTGNGVLDVLTIIHAPLLPTPRGIVISLFTCDDGYQLASTEIIDTPEGMHVEVPNAIDLNNNGRTDILLRYNEVIGMKYHETVYLLEWDGAALDVTWGAGPVYGGHGDIRLNNLDEDPATLEFTVPYYYAYESGTATSFNQFSFVRDIETVYTWQNNSWQAGCTHFSDDEELGYSFTILHSAEVWRACGEFDEAGGLYFQLWSGGLPLLPDYWGTMPPIVYSDDLPSEERLDYAATIAGRYLSAFAGYRLIQLDIHGGNLEDAEDRMTGLVNLFPAGQHGYLYVAMAQKLLDEVRNGATLDHACFAAEQTFQQVRDSDDDPGIDYVEDAPGGFYWYSGFDHGSNPDNLFAVPPNLEDMITIPICLQ